MRIISQCGTIDVPYDSGSLVIASGRYEDVKVAIIYYHNFSTTKGTKLAEYYSEAKAQKAMDMLRDAYLSRMELDGGYDTVHGCYIQPNYWVLPKVFQFPKDEDLEV